MKAVVPNRHDNRWNCLGICFPGYSGLSAIDDEEGLIGFSMDDTKPDGSHPALIA